MLLYDIPISDFIPVSSLMSQFLILIVQNTIYELYKLPFYYHSIVSCYN